MEVIKPYIGKYDGCSVFLNHGKYGPYLNYKLVFNKRYYEKNKDKIKTRHKENYYKKDKAELSRKKNII